MTSRVRTSTLIPRAVVALGLLLPGGCASTQALLAAQAVRAGCAPTNEASKIEFQVVDEEGDPLPGVAVRIENAVGASHSQSSDEKGWVSLEVSTPGRYDARLALSGFRSVRVKGIAVAPKCQVKLLVAMGGSARKSVVQ